MPSIGTRDSHMAGIQVHGYMESLIKVSPYVDIPLHRKPGVPIVGIRTHGHVGIWAHGLMGTRAYGVMGIWAYCHMGI